ncbi:MAG: glycosyltransferase [Aggregatilineales bacterium]
MIPRTSKPSISLFSPMYNVVGHIKSIARKAVQVLASLADDFEILVIDDGSTDGSARIADKLARQDERAQGFHHPSNQGYEQALRTGFARVSKAIAG